MSTKKTETSAAVEEKKSKTDIETRMEAGKVEVMKVVGGIPGAEKLAELIERGKKKGSLSASELLDVLEDMDLGAEQMDKIYDTLENLGIDTVGEDYIPELPDDVEPTIEAIEELPEEEIVDPNTMVDAFGTDDPVRMYLKEIGKVNLLTSDEEIDLAQAMGAGAEAKEQMEELESSGEEIPAEVRTELEKAIKKGERAKQRLAEANLRLVVSIAKRYVGRGMLFLDLIQEGKLADEGVTLADFSGGRAKQEGSYGQLAWNGELYHAFTVSAADCTLPNLTAPDGGILRLNISGDCTVDGGGTEYACFEGFDCVLVTGGGTLTVLNAAALDCGGRGSPHPLAGA